MNKPCCNKIYISAIIDNTRWNNYKPRAGDFIISTSYKSGTTWMQAILANLLIDKSEFKLSDLSPWYEKLTIPLEYVNKILEGQDHPRIIKTHLPIDAIPYYTDVNYIVVCREPRDVFMSLWNHYSNYTDEFYSSVNNSLPKEECFPECPSNMSKFWHLWTTRGVFPWESEGYPFWGNLRHTQAWWEYRNLDNILFVHFNNLLSKSEHEIIRICKHFQVPFSDDLIADVVSKTRFSYMKANSDRFFTGDPIHFKFKSEGFFNKGVNGRWKDILDTKLLGYETYISSNLTDDCADWLHNP